MINPLSERISSENKGKYELIRKRGFKDTKVTDGYRQIYSEAEGKIQHTEQDKNDSPDPDKGRKARKEHIAMKTLQSQADAILAYLKDGNGITPIDALNLCGCFRLSARIADLRKRGYDIVSEKIKVDGGKYVARYHLAI